MSKGRTGRRHHHPYQSGDEGRPLIKKSASDEIIDDTESEVERQDACRGMTWTAFLLFAILVSFRYFNSSWFFGHRTDTTTPIPPPKIAVVEPNRCPANIPFCRVKRDQQHVVQTGRKGFPSFWDYAPHGPISVTYDGRSFLLNGDRALFLSGSLHPVRATKQTWEQSLDQAVRNGLNMITIYVFWGGHQSFPDQEMDWTLPAGRGEACQVANQIPSFCGWSLADAIRAAADRGLFVHARIGPYVCAEYSYGGIPEWLAIDEPKLRMRRLNKKWLEAMETYVKSTIDYLTENKLFAHLGGPIVMAQIENELGEEDDDDNIPVMDDDIPPLVENDSEEDDNNNAYDDDDDDDDLSDGGRVLQLEQTEVDVTRNVTVQDYADWCGDLVARLAPSVVWTMCNGLRANNTIITCNGDCSSKWLEDHGSSGRIQVDQPAMWTEDEGGFQIWGDDAKKPSDYFWGRTARAMAYDSLRWFARGGSHLNYYMFSGGYNRGRVSAGGIMNAYATDAPLCPSGQPRQPKFDHFAALHREIRHVAPILLEAPTAVNHGVKVEHLNEDGRWEIGGEQRMFVYRTNHTRKADQEVVFVENDSKTSVIVKLALGITTKEELIVEMHPFSAMLIKDSSIRFDSFAVNSAAMSYERKLDPGLIALLGWSSCAEMIGTVKERPSTIIRTKPVEQTALNIGANVSSDYAWFETGFNLKAPIKNGTIFIETQKANALLLFLDGVFQDEVSNHEHDEANLTFAFDIGPLDSGHHVLSLLSESFGYSNLIGRWGAKTTEKVKGITGDVVFSSEGRNRSLVDGSKWSSSPGLNGAATGYCRDVHGLSESAHPTWTTTMFNTPSYDASTHALYLNITRGRGHFWLNGHNLGRFWNITRGDTGKYSQQYYFLPPDYLDDNSSVNKLVFFDVFGGDLASTNLVLSWLEESESVAFKDEVDFPLACIV